MNGINMNLNMYEVNTLMEFNEEAIPTIIQTRLLWSIDDVISGFCSEFDMRTAPAIKSTDVLHCFLKKLKVKYMLNC